MLRKRSRVVSSKEGMMPETTTISSPTSTFKKLTPSSLFLSPRLLFAFSPKAFSDSESAMSPTSILETKHLSSSIGNPFFSDRKSRKPFLEPNPIACTLSNTSVENKHHPWRNGDSKAIGLGIVDSLTNENNHGESSNAKSRMVVFGSHLKVQIPTIWVSSIESRHSPSTEAFVGCLSPREMEMSEDYTCVISHGPNPKTTHIYDNCIVESCGDGFIAAKDNRQSVDRLWCRSDHFLSHCHACKKSLEQGKDVFVYKGEKAFCSKECRYQDMLFDEEGTRKCSLEAPSISL